MYRLLRAIRPAIVFSALCCGIVAVGLFLSRNAPALAQDKTAKTAPPPGMLLGKTFEQCEKVLGKPALIRTPIDYSYKLPTYIRYYKVPCPGMTRIILVRSWVEKNGGENVIPAPKTVNELVYEFPKGTKTWQQAFALIGLTTKGVKSDILHNRTTIINGVAQPEAGPLPIMLSSIAGGRSARWFPAEDENNPDGLSPHRKDDCLDFNEIK